MQSLPQTCFYSWARLYWPTFCAGLQDWKFQLFSDSDTADGQWTWPPQTKIFFKRKKNCLKGTSRDKDPDVWWCPCRSMIELHSGPDFSAAVPPSVFSSRARNRHADFFFFNQKFEKRRQRSGPIR